MPNSIYSKAYYIQLSFETGCKLKPYSAIKVQSSREQIKLAGGHNSPQVLGTNFDNSR